MKQFLFFLSFTFLFTCYSEKQSNFDVSQYEGLDFSGNKVILKDLPFRRLAINVYAPTCIPCVKEIPALNYIYREISPDKTLGFYMVVDPYDIVTDADMAASRLKSYTPRQKRLWKKKFLLKRLNFPF